MTVAVDGEDHRQPLSRVRAQVRTILNPIDKTRGFRSEANAQKRVNRKGRVAQPGIPIIPIARPTDHFGKTVVGAATMAPVGSNVSSFSISADRSTSSRQRPR